MVDRFTNFLWLTCVSFLALCCSAHLYNAPSHQRSLKLSHECGEIIDTITKEEIHDLFALLLKYTKHLDAFSSLAIESSLPKIKYGFQTRKICASCTDFSDLLSRNSLFQEFCGPEVYGNDATMSGLLVTPITDTSEGAHTILPGPLKGAVQTHGTSSQTFVVPSELNLSGDPEEFFYVFLAYASSASFGAVTILPDYIGYGESHQFFKSYHIKKAYQTSTIPLWLEAKRIVATETNCNSELVDVAAVSGFSEGGYAAVAVADGLTGFGVDVTAYPGGGAYRISSAQILEMLRRFDAGLIPPHWNYLAAVLGASYSSTNPDLANFEAGQDMVDKEYLSTTDSSKNVVHWLADGLPPWAINALIPVEEPLSVMNQKLLVQLRAALSENVTYFCQSSDVLANFDKLCEALVDNDLTETLESARYPVELCFSPDDEIIPPQNLPNSNANPDFLSIYEVSGGHAEAGMQCVARYMMYLADEYTEETVEFSGVCTKTYTARNGDDGSTTLDGSVGSGASGLSSADKTAYKALAIGAMYLMLA